MRLKVECLVGNLVIWVMVDFDTTLVDRHASNSQILAKIKSLASAALTSENCSMRLSAHSVADLQVLDWSKVKSWQEKMEIKSLAG